MMQSNTFTTAMFAGAGAALIALITFTLSWNFYDFWKGPIPGYGVLLFPAKLSLVYVWHPLFTEEIDLLPKLSLMLIGQFVLVASVVACSVYFVKKIAILFNMSKVK